MLVALDDRFVSHWRSARFESGLPTRSALSQAVPARVRGFCQLGMPAPVGFRVLAARLLLPEPVRIGQRRFDRPMDLAVVDVTLLRPEDVLSVREATRAANVV